MTQNLLNLAFTCHKGERQDWGNLQGNSIALVISQIAHQQPTLVITPIV